MNELIQSVQLKAKPAMTACLYSNGKWVCYNMEQPSHASMWVVSYVGHCIRKHWMME